MTGRKDSMATSASFTSDFTNNELASSINFKPEFDGLLGMDEKVD
jgi:hypothetical protein